MTSLYIVPTAETSPPLVPFTSLDTAPQPALVREIEPNLSPGPATLSSWRLKRVLDYIDQHLAEPVRLADLARCAGLSRMYFAAQFRMATGLRPREYLLRKRIIRAQRMMATSHAPLVEVGLSVGFQSQAYFTTVFKRFVSEPPHRWRRRHQPKAVNGQDRG